MENAARESYNLYINGQWVDASDGGTFKSYCPANGEYLSTCAEATREDVDAAVDAAWAAWELEEDDACREGGCTVKDCRCD